jgi:outer membrane protein assembly factor BamB
MMPERSVRQGASRAGAWLRTVASIAVLLIACGKPAGPPPVISQPAVTAPPSSSAEVIRRLALARTIERQVDDPEKRGTPASFVEPFAGGLGYWLEPASAGVQSKRFSVTEEEPVLLHELASGRLARDRVAASRQGDALALECAGGAVRAWNLASGKSKWRSPVGASTPCTVTTTAAEAIVVTNGYILALARESGALLWRKHLIAAHERHFAGAGVFVALAEGAHVLGSLENEPPMWRAFDASNGEALWAIPVAHPERGRFHPAVGAANDKLVALGGVLPGAALIVNPRSGKELGRVPLTGEMEQLVLGEDSLFAIVDHAPPDQVDGSRRAALVRASTSTFQREWTAKHNGGAKDVALAGTVTVHEQNGLVFLTALGLARIYDGRSGERLWDWSLGESTEGASGIGDTALVATSLDSTPRVTYATTRAFYVFEAADVPPPVEDVAIFGVVRQDGRPQGGVRIYAHGVVATTRADGSYAIELPGVRGAVAVSLLAGSSDQSTRVPLDGRRRYHVDLEIAGGCPNGCNGENDR